MIWSNDRGEYTCGDCGHKWAARSRSVWWPLRFKWGELDSSCWFKRHRWQIGCDGIEQRVFGQTFHFGRLKVCFGHAYAAKGVGL